MPLKLIIFIALALLALLVLGWVSSHGLRRSVRLRRFAAARGGAFCKWDEFGLSDKLRRFEWAEGMLPGRAVRLPAEGGALYLFDLVGANTSVTAVLCENTQRQAPDFELRSHLLAHQEDELDAPFEVVPPDAVSERATQRLGDVVGEHRWVLSAQRRGGVLLVRNEGRLLQPEEWEAFVEVAQLMSC